MPPPLCTYEPQSITLRSDWVYYSSSLLLNCIVEMTCILLVYDKACIAADGSRIEFPVKDLLFNETIAWLDNATRRYEDILCICHLPRFYSGRGIANKLDEGEFCLTFIFHLRLSISAL